MKKIILIILSSFLLIMPLKAVSSNEVDYEIEEYIVDAKIDLMGNLHITEVLRIDGTYNGYIRDLLYKNITLDDGYLNKYTWDTSIYEATNIELYKVGTVNWTGELTYDVFDEDVTLFSECTDSTLCYEKTEVSNGISLKMFNETRKSSTYFYIDYLLGNAVVQHNDIAELYFPFVGDSFDDDINNYQLRVILPQQTTEQIRVWAHGPYNGESFLLTEGDNNEIFDGAYVKVDKLYANTPVDIRMTFPKELIGVYFEGITKETKTDALDIILEVEQSKADEANVIREKARKYVNVTYILTGSYLLIAGALIVYIYLKYDKEIKADFDSEYYREFIDDYDVTSIEYLFDKRITEKSFSTSLLNLIYKKKIKVEEIDGKKKNYKFIKISEEDITPAEKKLMDLIFNEAGSENEVRLDEIKTYAKQLRGTTSPFLNSYNSWNSMVKQDAIREKFYENNHIVKVYFSLYTIIGFVLLFLQNKYGLNPLIMLLTLGVSIFILIYMATFTKRTPKGALHYAKWKAFKNFLNDFGRFDEKELPEIVLWERYLVYANIFGLASKVGKTMKIKFNELGYQDGYNTNMALNYMIFSDLNSSINSTVSSSVSTAHYQVNEAVARSTNSSGGGFGGGFSGGSGFSGGGGGRGF